MAVTDPPLQSPPLEGLPNKLTRIWDRFFRDVFTAAGGNAGNPYPTGVVLDFTGTTAPAGWILAQEGFIGSRTSGADVIAADAARDLYVLWWNSFSDTIATVSGGRGTSGLQDFVDGKQMAIPIKPGTVLGLAGSHTDYTTRSFGEEAGSETHTLTASESGVPSLSISDPGHNHTQNAHTHTQNAHNHGVTDSGHTHGAGSLKGDINDTDGSTNNTAADNSNGGGGTITQTQNITGSTASATTGITINNATATNQNTTATNNSNTTGITITGDNTDASSAHNIIQPTIFVNKIIKL